jgi:glycosyltransferase involved in cell wall biosynthesis
MRIAFVVHQFFPEFKSGTERVTLNLARAAQRAGHHVRVLACVLDERWLAGWQRGKFPGAAEHLVDGVPVTALPRSLLPLQVDSSLDICEPLVEPLIRWFSDGRFDVVHVMHTMRMVTAVVAAQRAGLPFIVTLTDFFAACMRVNLVDAVGQPCQGPQGGAACARKCLSADWPPDALRARVEAAAGLLSAASARVVPSAFVAERMRLAFPALPFIVLPHGVDLLAMLEAQRGPGRPAAPGRRHLAFIGSIIPAKGLHVLLRALALVPDCPLVLSVAGAFHVDPAYEREIRALAAADSRVRLLGRLDEADVARLVAVVDLLCLPSLVPESYSLVLHECAALGVPALVADRGAPAQAMRAHGGGGVVRGDEAADWAAAIDTWLRNDAQVLAWRNAVPLPPRVEEEAFLYEGLYRQAAAAR